MTIQRVPTGIQGLDKMMGGGLPLGSMVLLVGKPGTGKTIFASQFLHTGSSKYASKGLYVCFAETKKTFLRNMLEFGWDFELLEKHGRAAILDLPVTREPGLQANLDVIMDKMNSLKSDRLVIDSLNSVSMALKENIDKRVMVHLLYKALNKVDCTSILIEDQPLGSSALGNGIAESVVDGIIHLGRPLDQNNEPERKLRILKMRGIKHTEVHHKYKITMKGIELQRSRKKVI